MSSRYQSRLLTALSEGALKLKDQAQRRLRQAQLAALWSAQVVLYPVYAAFQSTRVISRQIGRTAQRVIPRLGARLQPASAPPESPLAPPASDSPIRRTLRSLDLFALPLPVARPGHLVAPGPSPALAQPPLGPLVTDQPVPNPPGQLAESNASGTPVAAPTAIAANGDAKAALAVAHPQAAQIQGIACLLASQRLVLVDQRNAIHDVLTPAQADYLQRRLVLELATFWQAHKQIRLAQQPVTPLPLPRDRRNMLPAVRLWQRAMAWMQTSPVALSIDLFQESRLPSSLLHSLPPSGSLPPSLPDAAALPAHPFPLVVPPPVPSAPPWWQRLPWPRFGPRPEAASKAILEAPTWLDPDHQGSEQGWQSANRLAQARQGQLPPTQPSLPAPQRQWWTGLWPWGDKDGGDGASKAHESGVSEADGARPVVSEAAMVPAAPMALEPTSSASSYRPSDRLLDDIEQYLRLQPNAEAERSPQSKLHPNSMVPGVRAPLSQEPTSQGLGDLASRHSFGFGDREENSQQQAAQPLATAASTTGLQTTWLEAKVTPLGYERHPLEVVLGWVDRSLLWVETWLVKIFKWVSPSPPE